MTAIADMLSDRDRRRLAERLAELRETAALMRERGGVAPPSPPRPLHRMAVATAKRNGNGGGRRPADQPDSDHPP